MPIVPHIVRPPHPRLHQPPLFEQDKDTFTYDLEEWKHTVPLVPWNYEVYDASSKQAFPCHAAAASEWRCFSRMTVVNIKVLPVAMTACHCPAIAPH